jgi:hypothetical protein
MSAQRKLALDAVRSGARTSRELSIAMGITRGHASVLLYNMAQERTVRPTGEFVRPAKRGWSSVVYEALPTLASVMDKQA